ncbi:hypothetical protein C8R44DRAFT_863319 [Mycena epipterygia]|nr:hypothetical protein C8R44DRAFT_863319 [Mycena epipterygia]
MRVKRGQAGSARLSRDPRDVWVLSEVFQSSKTGSSWVKKNGKRRHDGGCKPTGMAHSTGLSVARLCSMKNACHERVKRGAEHLGSRQAGGGNGERYRGEAHQEIETQRKGRRGQGETVGERGRTVGMQIRGPGENGWHAQKKAAQEKETQVQNELRVEHAVHTIDKLVPVPPGDSVIVHTKRGA